MTPGGARNTAALDGETERDEGFRRGTVLQSAMFACRVLSTASTLAPKSYREKTLCSVPCREHLLRNFTPLA